MATPRLQAGPVFVDVATGSISSVPMNIVIGEASSSTNTTREPLLSKPSIAQIKAEAGASTTRATSPLAPFEEIQPRRIRCNECATYSAENEEKMLRHVRKVHRGENPFQCYMCDYSTYNKVLFEEHVRIHQGIKPFKCSHCPYRSASKKNAKKHEQIHRDDNPNKCQKCGFVARHTKGLERHMTSMHSENSETNIDPRESHTKCPHCNKRFGNLELHLKSRFECTLCPPNQTTLICNRHLVKKHMLTVHGQKSRLTKNDFLCAICQWTSNIRPKILLHLIHHPNQPVDESVVDINILKQCGIVGQGW